MLKVIRATRKSMPQFQGPVFLETWDLSQISWPNLKNKNATLINALIGNIFWNKNISCHDTFKWTVLIHWLQWKKPQLSAKSHFWKNQEKPPKIGLFFQNEHFCQFSWFYKNCTLQGAEFFLRWNQCLKTLHLSYQARMIFLFDI